MSLFETGQKYLLVGARPRGDNNWYCEDRGQLKARLPQWYKLLQSAKLSDSDCAIVTAIIGELANNCFDHNLGMWTDAPGCLIGLSVESQELQILVADRGQGIVASLKRQLPKGSSNKSVLNAAFERRISGRSPEQRGNGLKFVLNELDGVHRRLFCFSSGESYQKGKRFLHLDPTEMLKKLNGAPGTLVAIEWDLL